MSVARLIFFLFAALPVMEASSQLLTDPEINCAHMKGEIRKHYIASARQQQSAQDDYDVKFYFLDIQADNLSAFVKANVTMKAQVVTDGLSAIAIGLSNLLQVDSVFIDGVKVSFTHTDDMITFNAPAPLSKNNFFTTAVYYQGNGQTASFFSGITNAEATTGDQVTYTLSEPENAIDWFACKQSLLDKADSAYIFITVPAHLKAASNGVLSNVADVGSDHKRFEWKTRYPIAYYLISIAVAEYDEYNTSVMVDGKEMLLQNYIYQDPSVIAGYKPLLDITGDMVVSLSGLFGPYPFANEKYGHAMAPLGGGMEHQTMSTMDGFSFTLIAHELGHQWFGNNVTCGTWQDIWINEGFARYAEYLMIEKLMSKEEADAWMGLVYNNALTRTSGSVYVPLASAQDEGRIFDGSLTYNKGGALVHMIRFIIGDDDVFFQVLRTFQEQFRDGTATGEDFKTVLETVSGKDFDDFFTEWYYGQGYPEFRIRWNYDSDSLYIRQMQETTHSSVNFYHIPVEYLVEFADGETVVRTDAVEPNEVFSFYTGKEVTKVTMDPQRIILKKLLSIVRDPDLKAPVITAAEKSLSASFDIYPNPAVSAINISSRSEEAFDVSVIDLQGRECQGIENVRGEIELGTTGMSPGVYAVKIITGKGVVVRKVVIK